MSLSLLLRNPNLSPRLLSLLTQTPRLSDAVRSSAFHTDTDRPTLPDPKTSLSARMSFVFDQIDAIEKDRENKDDALQRIRAWRETKKKKTDEDDGAKKENEKRANSSLFKKEIEVVHPWPEWVELMERLVQQNYFDHRRRDEDKIVKDLDIDVSNFPVEEEGYDFSRDWAAVRTACLNFGRDRFDILRSLSRQDIQILVGHGCPSTDKKVVFSGKILRKHVHLDEGDVCSSCNLRSTCEKAYLLSRKEDEARTIDVIRILLAYGFDPIKETVQNKSLLKLKTVKTVVRKLLHEVVKLSAVPIDPNLSPPIIKKPPPKVKQPPPPPRKRIGRDDVEMKKGDWLCPKCDFMNFAKNTVCLQCDAKRPKRQLLPGEWECPECNFLNYRRNMACFHCEHKRPHDEFMENQTLAKEKGPKTRFERVNDVPAGSNSWNFDFDDNESDGADVAAFEYADPPRIAEDFPEESHAQGGNLSGYEDSFGTNRISRSEGSRYSDHDKRKLATGFDDFDDEEDDDIDSYELEASNNNQKQEPSRNFSEVEEFSGSEDFDGDHHAHVQRSPSRLMRKKAFSGSDDDRKSFNLDGEPSVYSDWKSSHVGDSRNGIKGSGRSGLYKKKAFDSDSELDIDSGSDGDLGRGNGLNKNKRNKLGSNKRDFRRGGYSGSEDELGFSSESDDDDLQSHKSKFGGNRGGPVRRGNTFSGRGQFGSVRDNFRSNDRMNDRRDSFVNADRGRSPRGSHRNNRESAEDGHSGRRNSFGNTGRSSRGSFKNSREYNEDGYSGRRSDDRQFYRPNSGSDRQRGGRGFRQNGRSNGFNDRSETVGEFTDDRPRRTRIIER